MTSVGASQDGFVRAVQEASVCTLEAAFTLGSQSCDDADGGVSAAPRGSGRSLLHFAQSPDEPLNWPLLTRELPPRAVQLQAYFRMARERAGRAPHRRLDVQIRGQRGGPFYGFVGLPPVDGLVNPRITLQPADRGQPERELAEAIFALAHLSALAGMHDYQGDPRDRRLVPGVDSWLCTRDCDPWGERFVVAACMAGAFVAWTRSPAAQVGPVPIPPIDAATVARIREMLLARNPRAVDAANGFPDGRARLAAFDRGYNSPNPADPYACEAPRT
jgi:hypothetical protein